MKLIKKVFIFLLIFIAILSCNTRKDHIPPQKLQQQPAAAGPKYTGGNKEQPIWTSGIPDSGLIKGEETYIDEMVRNVARPTMTVFSPKRKNTGVAVIVFPGGGYNKLAVELEGSEICQWFASIGVTGILLKYRVPASGSHYDAACECRKDPVKPMALQDAQRTVGLVRYRAKEWNIDPAKIGVIGFSAGGHLVADVSTNYTKRVYTLTDDADKISCRPDFGMSIFPGHMLEHTNKPYELNPTLPVNKNTPPMFLLQAGNDPVDTIQNSLVYYIALKRAGVHAEYHIYAEGGHAFGVRKNGHPITEGWPKLAETWLHTIGMIKD